MNLRYKNRNNLKDCQADIRNPLDITILQIPDSHLSKAAIWIFPAVNQENFQILTTSKQVSIRQKSFGTRIEYHTYHVNEHGDVELILGITGEIGNQYHYDTFGILTKAEELVENR